MSAKGIKVFGGWSRFDLDRNGELEPAEIEIGLKTKHRGVMPLSVTAFVGANKYRGQDGRQVVAIFKGLRKSVQHKLFCNASYTWLRQDFLTFLSKHDPSLARVYRQLRCKRATAVKRGTSGVINLKLPRMKFPRANDFSLNKGGPIPSAPRTGSSVRKIAKRRSFFAGFKNTTIARVIRAMPVSRFAFQVSPKTFTAKKYPTINATIKPLISSSPTILAFGETHSHPQFVGMNTARYFAQHILPAVKGRYRDLVLEFIPSDLPKAEMNWFMRHGRLDAKRTPLLKLSLGVLNDKGKDCLHILHACRRNGITVHGGGPSTTQYGSILVGIKPAIEAVKFIRDNSRRALNRIAGRGRKVLFYGGAYHNDINGGPRNAAFGKALSRRHSYVEVDIVVPNVLCDLMRRLGSRTAIHTMKLYDRFILNQQKITLVKRQPKTFALVLPLKSVPTAKAASESARITINYIVDIGERFYRRIILSITALFNNLPFRKEFRVSSL